MAIGYRTYQPGEVASFLRVRDEFGLLSNFHRLDIRMGGRMWKSSEAIYQALRFPQDQDVQWAIYEATNAYDAKMACKAALAAGKGRPDWEDVKVQAMRWALAIKGRRHVAVRRMLAQTEDRPIVEISYKDPFWGAKPQYDGGPLVGRNVLGRLWMERRQLGWEERPAPFDDDLLLGEPIRDMWE